MNICTKCETREVRARGLCSACYERKRRRGNFKEAECALCHTVGAIWGRGLCQLCYQRERLAGRLDNYSTRTQRIKETGQELIGMYESGMTVKEISEKTSIPHTTALVALNSINTGMRSAKKRWEKRVPLDETVFDWIDDEHAAYWLGFLYADGSVTRYRVTIELHIQDEFHLDQLLMFLKSAAKKRYRVKDGQVRTVAIDISSVYLANQLARLGIIVGRNHIELTLLSLPDKLISHFIRGYFDGDGWIGNQGTYGIAFWGQYDILSWINQQISLRLNLPERKIKERHHIYSIRYDGKGFAFRVAEWLYSDASIYLPRKYYRFMKWQQK